MVAGAPRTVSLEPYEMIKLGEEMVKWVSDPINDVYHLSEWYTIHKGFTYKEWKTFIRKEEFVPYYEQSLKIIGKKYLNGTVKEALAQRWQRTYFGDIREREDEEQQEKLDRELEHKKNLMNHQDKLNTQTITGVSEEMMKVLESFTTQVSESHSDLKIAKSKSKADT